MRKPLSAFAAAVLIAATAAAEPLESSQRPRSRGSPPATLTDMENHCRAGDQEACTDHKRLQDRIISANEDARRDRSTAPAEERSPENEVNGPVR